MFKPSAKFFKKKTLQILERHFKRFHQQGIKTDKFLQSYARNCKHTKRRKKISSVKS